MAFVIGEECIGCGVCASGCPVEAIVEGSGVYAVEGDKCIDCGACGDVCPVGAPKQV